MSWKGLKNGEKTLLDHVLDPLAEAGVRRAVVNVHHLADQIEAGRVKAFAVTTAKRLDGHKLLKDYPSLQEMGLKDFNLTIWHGLYAPKGTPPEVTKRLNDALQVALKDPAFIKSQEDLGAIVVTDNRMTPAGHKAFVANEITKLKAAIDAAGQFAD